MRVSIEGHALPRREAYQAVAPTASVQVVVPVLNQEQA